MSDDRENIIYHLLQRTKSLACDISIQNQLIEGAENTIKEAKKKLLNLSAERQAILEKAIDYGYNPETDEIT